MIVILEGESGTGKTSVMAAVAQRAKAAGRRVSGVLCPGRFEAGEKHGIDAVDLETGDSWLLAYAPPAMGRGPSPSPRRPRFDDSAEAIVAYGRWAFVRSALAKADEAICREAGARAGRRLVVIDEIGPLEVEHGSGLRKALALLDAAAARDDDIDDDVVVDFLVAARPEIAQALAARWRGARRITLQGMAGSGAELAAAEACRVLSLRR